MNLIYKTYFSFVFALFIYGFEFNTNYLLTFLFTNMYYTGGEYLFHRLTFHNSDYFPKLTKSHSKHHDEPTNERRLFIPIAVTITNDILFALLNYMLNMNVMYFISASHLSYLLFEASHYASHIPNNYLILPNRLVAFHNHHHHDPTINFGFTTPAWDIMFGTASNFPISKYPFSRIPLSIVSFIKI
jgi:sterol desaturase/sphingolipid hydroxylase (fatty acid hydroxylase superfamily)